MNSADVSEYWVPAMRGLYGKSDVFSAYKLDKDLGVKEYTPFFARPQTEEVPLAPELLPVLRALAGPHAKAILKAYRVRKGLE